MERPGRMAGAIDGVSGDGLECLRAHRNPRRLVDFREGSDGICGRILALVCPDIKAEQWQWYLGALELNGGGISDLQTSLPGTLDRLSPQSIGAGRFIEMQAPHPQTPRVANRGGTNVCALRDIVWESGKADTCFWGGGCNGVASPHGWDWAVRTIQETCVAQATETQFGNPNAENGLTSVLWCFLIWEVRCEPPCSRSFRWIPDFLVEDPCDPCQPTLILCGGLDGSCGRRGRRTG